MLREMVPEDVDEIYHLYEDSKMTEYLQGLFEDRAEEQEYMRSYYNTIYKFYGFGIWLITLKDGTIIGRAGVENNSDGEFELGYMLASKYWHQGYALEACEAVLNYMEEVQGLERKEIICRIYKENTASARLAEKLNIQIRFLEEILKE